MPLIQTKHKGPVSTASALPETQNLQIVIPFADAMRLNKIVLKRLGEGVRSRKATKAAVVAEAIRLLAEKEGVTYTSGETA